MTTENEPLNVGYEEPESGDVGDMPVDDSVSLYFRQMAVEPLLTAEQEVILAKRIQSGLQAGLELEENGHEPELREKLQPLVEDGQEAREHLSRANTRLVISIAKKYMGQGLPMADLIQEGNVGLMIAVDKFDYTLGNRFSTYASWWIWQVITRALSQKSRTIRLPLYLTDQLRRIDTTNERLEQELGREPEDDEIDARLELPEGEARATRDKVPYTISYDQPVGEDSEVGDFIEGGVDPVEATHQSILEQTVQAVLQKASIKPRQIMILKLRFGLGGGKTHTLDEVAAIMGLSRERIRQLEEEAVEQLQNSKYKETLRDFLP